MSSSAGEADHRANKPPTLENRNTSQAQQMRVATVHEHGNTARPSHQTLLVPP